MAGRKRFWIGYLCVCIVGMYLYLCTMDERNKIVQACSEKWFMVLYVDHTSTYSMGGHAVIDGRDG